MRWWSEINDVQSQIVVCCCWGEKMWLLILSMCMCVSGGTQNTIIMAFVWSLTRLSTACRRTRSTWQWDNNLSIRNRGEMNIPSLSFSLACNLHVPDFFAIRITHPVFVCMSYSIVHILLELWILPPLWFIKSMSNSVPHWLNRWTRRPSFISDTENPVWVLRTYLNITN